MKIIVAEDDPLDRAIITQILNNLDHEVRMFPTGAAAWQAFQEEAADVIISDWVMPEIDGLDLCRYLRRSKLENYVYFIMITGGRTENTDHNEAIQAGVDDFLVKPICTGEIWRRLFVAKRILDFICRIQQIKALLPSCARCQKIRDDLDYWEKFAAYIKQQTQADPSNYICPECMEAHADRTIQSH